MIYPFLSLIKATPSISKANISDADSERRWPVTLAWRVPGSVTGGLLLEDGWRRIVQRFALKVSLL